MVQSVVLQAQTVTGLIEETVTGILDPAGDVQRPVGMWIDPAFGIRLYLFIDAAAGDLGVDVDHPFHQSGHRYKRLVGRSRSRLLLGGVIVERTGLVCHQFIIIFRIHGIGQPVVVISRIGNAGQHISGVWICHHQGTGAGFQTQLSRRDLQRFDLAPQEIIGSQASGSQPVILVFIVFKHTLLIDHHTDLPACDGTGFDHILIDQLVESIVPGQSFLDVLRHGLVSLSCIRIFCRTFQILRKPRGVHPVLGDGIIQEGVDVDGFLCLPCLIGLIVAVDGIGH